MCDDFDLLLRAVLPAYPTIFMHFCLITNFAFQCIETGAGPERLHNLFGKMIFLANFVMFVLVVEGSCGQKK